MDNEHLCIIGSVILIFSGNVPCFGCFMGGRRFDFRYKSGLADWKEKGRKRYRSYSCWPGKKKYNMVRFGIRSDHTIHMDCTI